MYLLFVIPDVGWFQNARAFEKKRNTYSMYDTYDVFKSAIIQEPDAAYWKHWYTGTVYKSFKNLPLFEYYGTKYNNQCHSTQIHKLT